MSVIIEALYKLRFYRAAYTLAEKYLPANHWLNFKDESHES